MVNSKTHVLVQPTIYDLFCLVQTLTITNIFNLWYTCSGVLLVSTVRNVSILPKLVGTRSVESFRNYSIGH